MASPLWQARTSDRRGGEGQHPMMSLDAATQWVAIKYGDILAATARSRQLTFRELAAMSSIVDTIATVFGQEPEKVAQLVEQKLPKRAVN